MSFFLRASSYSRSGSLFASRRSSRPIPESLSFITKSSYLIDHTLKLRQPLPLFHFLLTTALGCLNTMERLIPSSASPVLFSFAWELDDCAPSSHFLLLELLSVLAVERSHHFLSLHSSFHTSFYDCWRIFRELFWEHHSHFDRYFSLWLQLHMLNETCKQDHWSCANVAYSCLPLFVYSLKASD